MDNFGFLFFLAFAGFFIYMVFTKRGRGIMFGGKIVDTLNESIVQTSGIQKTTIKVHLIEKKRGETCIGIELTDNAKLAWSMRPLTFTQSEARQLIGMLNEAVSKT